MLRQLAWIALLLPAAVHCTECAPSLNGQGFAADLRFYSDDQCTNEIDYDCEYVGNQVAPAGEYYCESPGKYPSSTPFYAKMIQGINPNTQIIFTRDRSCPPGGADAVEATISDTASCVEVVTDAANVGITIYPNGGSGLAKRYDPFAGRYASSKRNDTTAARLALPKRDNGCNGFTISSSENSYTPSQQVSSIVACSPGNTDCMITKSDQHTTSVATMYSLTAGGSVGFLGDEATFSATFGQTYTESETSSVGMDYVVNAGQNGYLSVYAAATLFKGTFTGCNSGDSSQPGEVLAVKKNTLTYMVVYTSS